MRIMILLIVALAGCRSIAPPWAAREKPSPDQPGLTIAEQERRARDKYPMPSDDFRIGPGASGIDPTGSAGTAGL